jgi:glycosyltransferase involved in cell wall biosynthesis
LHTPRVSIVVPTYNRLVQLKETLPTILKQTFEDVEFVLLDDASVDGTEEWARSISDTRLRYLRNNTNLGIYANFQMGLSCCVGEYIGVYHDHDFYHPTIVERCCRILDENSSVSFVHTGLLWIGASKQITGIDVRDFPEVMLGKSFASEMTKMTASPVMAATALVRKDAYAAAGPYQPGNYGLGCDLMMWHKLALIGDVGYVSEPLALIRAREKNKGTAAFSWADVDKSSAMFRDIQRMLLPRHWHLYLMRRVKTRLKEEQRLTKLIARAQVLDQGAVNEGVRLCVNHRAAAALLVHAILSYVPGALSLARGYFLKYHYTEIDRYLAGEAVKAKRYLQSAPELESWCERVALGLPILDPLPSNV